MLPVHVCILEATGIVLPDDNDEEMLCLIQKSHRLVTFQTRPVPSATDVSWKERFTIPVTDKDSLLVLICYSSGTPLGSCKIPVFQIPQEGSLDISYDIHSYIDYNSNGKLHIIASYDNFATDSGNLLDSSGESYGSSDGSQPRRRRRKRPADVVISSQLHSSRRRNIDIDAILSRAERNKPRRRRVTHNEIEETGDGATVGNMLIQKKSKVVDESLQKHRIDPVKMKIFADYSVILEKNKQILSTCAKEGMMKDGIVKSPLSEATMWSLKFAIDETKRWTDKIKNTDV